MAEKKQFKAESKRLLDLMINSIYTHKEIFLRELISNASDATDKLYYKALTENISEINKSDLTIDLAFNKENRTLTVTDHGIGMNKEELEEHLGTIANSGSFKFKNENESDDIDIIGQFGVGFYSAFMVAKKVEVSSRAYGSDQGYTWVSEASDGYEIFETDNLPTGTTIKLYLKDNTEEENYDDYLDQYHIESLVRKFSDYVHYPIKMDVTTSKKKEDSDEYEDVVENKTLNSMVPLWKRNKMSICIVVGLLLYFVAMTNDSYSSLFLGTNLQKLSLIHTQIWTWPPAGLGESLLFVSIGMKIYETNRQDRRNIYMLIVSFIMLFFESYFLQSMSPKDANCYISLIFCAPLLFIECLKKFRISFNTELLGKISMYIYMTHPIVLAIICNFVVFNNTFYKFFVVTFVTLLISIITYRLKNRRIL